jgi:hypothetical protein
MGQLAEMPGRNYLIIVGILRYKYLIGGFVTVLLVTLFPLFPATNNCGRPLPSPH